MSGMTYKKVGIQIIFFYAVLFTCLALYDEKPCPELAKDMSRAPLEIMEPANASALLIRPPKYRIEGSGKGAINEPGRDLEGVSDIVKEFAYNTVLRRQDLYL